MNGELNTSCNQLLSLAEESLSVAHAGRNRSMVARTSMCGWAIKSQLILICTNQYVNHMMSRFQVP